MAREKEIYIGFSERWRNIPKPTIAAVQGRCIMGGLMLIWPCDIIIASEDAEFVDHAVSFGIGGVEYFAHAWEMGARKVKEFLFTSDWMTAQEAHRLGTVNHVVPRDQLQDAALAMAAKIARKPLFALKMAKESVNAMEDVQGTGRSDADLVRPPSTHPHAQSEGVQPLDGPFGPAARNRQGARSKDSKTAAELIRAGSASGENLLRSLCCRSKFSPHQTGSIPRVDHFAAILAASSSRERTT